MTSNREASREETISSTLIHQGKSFSFVSDQVRLPNGKTAQRDYVDYPEAVVILPVLDDGSIILIEQYRHSLGEILLELPAGKMEPGETDRAQAARRELLEETGYACQDIRYLFTYYPAVGYSSEKIHAFAAAGLTEAEGTPDDDEFISPRPFTENHIRELLESNTLKDGKTLLVLSRYFQYYKGV